MKTTDGGRSWFRIDVDDPQGNVSLEGVGFVDEQHGWVGGWGSPDLKAGSTSETVDGGRTWTDANEIGRFINRFRFLGRPVTVGYAAGRTVYKYSSEPIPRRPGTAAIRLLEGTEPRATGAPVSIPLAVPTGAGRLTVDVWDRFGDLVRQLVDDPDPEAGSRTVEWDVADDAGHPLRGGDFVLRVTVDGASESQILHVTA